MVLVTMIMMTTHYHDINLVLSVGSMVTIYSASDLVSPSIPDTLHTKILRTKFA